MGDNFAKNIELVKQITTFAKDKGCTPVQLALAWVLAQGEHIIPILGTRQIERLQENIGALEISLSQNELIEINNIFPKEAVVGSRYPEEM